MRGAKINSPVLKDMDSCLDQTIETSFFEYLSDLKRKKTSIKLIFSLQEKNKKILNLLTLRLIKGKQTHMANGSKQQDSLHDFWLE